MFTVRLAELNISIENKYDYIHDMCRDYITNGTVDFSVSVSDSEIASEDNGTGADKGYLESLAVYRKIAQSILEYNGFLLHGAVIDVKGCGIAFLAKSGVGKSTHMALWKQMLKNEMTVVNGDKPLIRIKNGGAFAYGTAWAGKENLHINTKTHLKKICFIERSAENKCVPLDKSEILEKLINQIYLPENKTLFLKTLGLINELTKNTEFYLIRCNTGISAAERAYKGLGL